MPDYLSSAERGTTRNLMDYGVSLGRRFRALKLWLVLRYFGRAGIVARLRDHVGMAKEFAAHVEAAEDWRVVAPTHLSAVAFRFAPEWGDGEVLDAANQDILDRVNASGEAFLTHTVLDGLLALDSGLFGGRSG